jgi:hypothetical protein
MTTCVGVIARAAPTAEIASSLPLLAMTTSVGVIASPRVRPEAGPSKGSAKPSRRDSRERANLLGTTFIANAHAVAQSNHFWYIEV